MRLSFFLRKTLLVASAVCGAFVVTAGPALAFPERNIRIVVPFEAGGTTDLLARMVADGIGPLLGQPVVVLNKGGAGGNIGAREVALAPPDGYTLMMGTPGTQAINALVYKNPGYDPIKSFAPVAYVASVANVFLTSPRSGIKNMEDLLKTVKANPGKLNWGTPGIGSSGHLSLEMFKQLTGTDITHVPYKGAGLARNDLLAGVIELSSDNLPTAVSGIKAGQMIALGVSSPTPDPTLPDVSPIANSVPGYEMSSWFVVMAPAGTPADVVDKLNGAINTWLKEPKTRERLAELAAVPVGGTPQFLADHILKEQDKYRKLVKLAGVTPQ